MGEQLEAEAAALERQLAEFASFRATVERSASLIQRLLDLGLTAEQMMAVKGLHDQIVALKKEVAAQRHEVDVLTRLTRRLMTLAYVAARKSGVTSQEFVEAEAAFDATMLLTEFEGWASMLDPRPED